MRAVWCELVSGCESLIYRENTEKCRESDISSGADCVAEAQSGVLTAEFPAFGNREICAIEQGLLRSRSIFQPEAMLDDPLSVVSNANVICCFPSTTFGLFRVSLPKTPSAVWSSGSTLISMMESPDLGVRHRFTESLRLHRARLRRVLRECEVGSEPVVVPRVGRDHPMAVPLVQDDHMIEALSTQRSNEPLRVGVLPW